MLIQWWASVVDDGPTLNQHWMNVSCFWYLRQRDDLCGSKGYLVFSWQRWQVWWIVSMKCSHSIIPAGVYVYICHIPCLDGGTEYFRGGHFKACNASHQSHYTTPPQSPPTRLFPIPAPLADNVIICILTNLSPLVIFKQQIAVQIDIWTAKPDFWDVFNPLSAEVFMHKPRRPKGFFNLKLS